MMRRQRLQLHLAFGIASAALILTPLLSFSLGHLEESQLIGVLLAAGLGSLALAEFLCRSSAPTDLEAAAKLDGASGQRALFATALDRRLDKSTSPIAELYLQELDRATQDCWSQEILERPDRRFLQLFLLLLALNAGFAAMPRSEEAAPAEELGKMREFLRSARASETLKDNQKEALDALSEARNRSELMRKLDDAWQKNREAMKSAKELEDKIEEALNQLAQSQGQATAPEDQRALESLTKLLNQLDAETAKRLSEKVRALADESTDSALKSDLNKLATAAAGAGAGLGAGTDAKSKTATEKLTSILLALYDGLGDQPPSGELPGPERGERRPGASQAPSGRTIRDYNVSGAEKALIERYFQLLPR